MKSETHKFLLSIIVPTRNRVEYAKECIKHLILIQDERIQIVIQDNSDSNELEGFIDKLDQSGRIKYKHTSIQLNFVENFSLSVELSDGEYICIIGDDDGVNPTIIEIVDWANKRNIEAIVPTLKAVYYWPDSIVKNNVVDTSRGLLFLSKVTGNSSIYNPSYEIIKLLKNGCQDYLRYNVVKVYHGIVKRSLMDKVKNKTGKYFGGTSPDIYSSVALSLVAEKVIKIDYPFTIPGICKKSGSANSANGNHTGELKGAPMLEGHKNYQWSPLVPSFYSVETVWADSALVAITDLGENELLKFFNVTALSVFCWDRHSKYKKYIDENYRRYIDANDIQTLESIINITKNKLFRGKLSQLWRRIIKKMKRIGKMEKRINVLTIDQAQKVLATYLERNRVSLTKIINNLK